MRSKTSLLDKVAILLFLVLLTMASLCFAETPGNGDKNTILTDNQNVTCELVGFTAKTVEYKTYINWKVISAFDNFYFILEKSEDGENYSVLDMKKAFISPAQQPLLYCFVDEDASEGTNVYYRVKLYKVKTALEGPKMLVLSQKNLFADNTLAAVVIPNLTDTELADNYNFK